MTRCGSERGYKIHVRDRTPKCARCRAAHARAQNRWKMRAARHGALMVDPTGTRRRLHALVAIGWTWVALGEAAGVHKSAVRGWSLYSHVSIESRDTTRELYRRLSDRPGGNARAAARAAAAGYHPPIAWDDDTIDDPTALPYAGERADVDEVALQRAITDRPVNLTRTERRELTRRLTDAGRSAQEISQIVGVTQRTVVRNRAAA